MKNEKYSNFIYTTLFSPKYMKFPFWALKYPMKKSGYLITPT